MMFFEVWLNSLFTAVLSVLTSPRSNFRQRILRKICTKNVQTPMLTVQVVFLYFFLGVPRSKFDEQLLQRRLTQRLEVKGPVAFVALASDNLFTCNVKSDVQCEFSFTTQELEV